MRRPVAALALAALLAACGDDGGSPPDDTTPAATTTEALSEAEVGLNQLLVSGDDLAPFGFQPIVVARPFTAQRATRIRLCDEDLRAELRLNAGRQSRFSDGTVEVSHTVTSGGDTNAFLERFNELVDGCEGPWTEAPLSTGGGPVTREITGRYPLPDVGVEGAGAVVRSRNAVGGSDTIVIVLVQGAVVSSLSVSGPVGADFDIVDPAVVAAAERLAQSLGVP